MEGTESVSKYRSTEEPAHTECKRHKLSGALRALSDVPPCLRGEGAFVESYFSGMERNTASAISSSRLRAPVSWLAFIPFTMTEKTRWRLPLST